MPATYRVTLDIEIEGDEFLSPDHWDWPTLLSIEADSARVIEVSPLNDEAKEHQARD